MTDDKALHRTRRSIQKLEDSPDRTVKESVGACRSVAKALAEQCPDLLAEFKGDLHLLLNRWMDRLEDRVTGSNRSVDQGLDDRREDAP